MSERNKLTATELQTEFKRRQPWFTLFWIEGQSFGGAFDAGHDPRVDQFFEHFPDARSILELGSLEGGHTLNIARRPGVHRVLSIEGRRANYDRAQFIKQVYGADNVTFQLANLEKARLTDWGQFEAVFCVGLLYHLPEPWKLIEQIARVSSRLFIWTHYAAEQKANKVVNGYRGLHYQEFGLKDVLSGLSAKSFWPTREALLAMLARHNFAATEIVEDDPGHMHGPAITLAARRA